MQGNGRQSKNTTKGAVGRGKREIKEICVADGIHKGFLGCRAILGFDVRPGGRYPYASIAKDR